MIEEIDLKIVRRIIFNICDIENRHKIWINILNELCAFVNDTIFKGADNPLFLYIRSSLK